MPYQGQIVSQLNEKGIHALLAKLNAKLSIGNLLALKAKAQGLSLTETNIADESYTTQWAINAANVSLLLVD